MRPSYALILLIGALSMGACDRGPELRYVFSPSGLSLREAPSTEAPVLGVLPYGAPLTVLAAVDSGAFAVVDDITGQWLQIRSGLQEGYVFSGYLTRFPPPSEPDVFPDTGLVQKRFVYGANVLSIRDSPARPSGPLAFVEYRDSLDVLLGGWGERSDELDGMEGSWVRVRWGAVEGYVFDGYLSGFRPLERRMTTTGQDFTLRFVHGIDTLTLHSAPDEDAPETGRLGYGDSLSVIPTADPTTVEVDGVPGTWVYGRSPVMEGFLFDGFLSETRPPAPDSAAANEAPPRPERRYILTTPGVRVWDEAEGRIFTQGFVHYGDSVLVLFGGGTARIADPVTDAGEALVRVKARSQEGLISVGALSPLPVPVPGSDLDTYLVETIGQTSVDTLPGYDTEADTGTVVTRYERGIVRTHSSEGPGLDETVYGFPGVTLVQAHEILKLCEANEYFETEAFPQGEGTVGPYEVTMQLAPGGEVLGAYSRDTRDGSLTAIERDSVGVVVTMRSARGLPAGADSTSTDGVAPEEADSASAPPQGSGPGPDTAAAGPIVDPARPSPQPSAPHEEADE
jgi:hypothetical protein